MDAILIIQAIMKSTFRMRIFPFFPPGFLIFLDLKNIILKCFNVSLQTKGLYNISTKDKS